jgi:dolichyl-phosphate beta-glucosyltransferase
MAKPFLSVIIPAYNEAKRLPLTLIDVDKHLQEQEYSYEILVVNDGSTDETAEIVNRFVPLIQNLKLIDNAENKGKGAVVRQGMLLAKGTWRVFMDADNSTSVVEFNKMIPYFKNGYEVVIGSRHVKGSKMSPPQPFYKRILGNAGNLMIQALLLPGIWDTQCGFKCFSRKRWRSPKRLAIKSERCRFSGSMTFARMFPLELIFRSYGRWQRYAGGYGQADTV